MGVPAFVRRRTHTAPRRALRPSEGPRNPTRRALRPAPAFPGRRGLIVCFTPDRRSCRAARGPRWRVACGGSPPARAFAPVAPRPCTAASPPQPQANTTPPSPARRPPRTPVLGGRDMAARLEVGGLVPLLYRRDTGRGRAPCSHPPLSVLSLRRGRMLDTRRAHNCSVHIRLCVPTKNCNKHFVPDPAKPNLPKPSSPAEINS
mmetsp:Transcript_20613/g.64096  ORF Transcript_20613/g.64096 Transcript_20613/m.64096 type:complete len:204 (+) Transcript_20613:484-1095(+)